MADIPEAKSSHYISEAEDMLTVCGESLVKIAGHSMLEEKKKKKLIQRNDCNVSHVMTVSVLCQKEKKETGQKITSWPERSYKHPVIVSISNQMKAIEKLTIYVTTSYLYIGG